jgi:hypothetical protein
MEYAQRKMNHLKEVWKFEDFARPLERNQTEKNNKQTIEKANQEIKEYNLKIQQLKEQMTKGVNPPTGV